MTRRTDVAMTTSKGIPGSLCFANHLSNSRPKLGPGEQAALDAGSRTVLLTECKT
jgi:hypothetical protein